MSFAILINEDCRIVEAGIFLPDTPPEFLIVDTLPEGECTDYLFKNGTYIYDPLPPMPTDFDRLDAQVTYTAMMTDTLLEG